MTQRYQNGRQNYLEHYGVKGMRWGVRKKSSSGSSKPPKAIPQPSEDFKTKVQLRGEIRKDRGRTRTLSNTQLNAVVKRMELEQRYDTLVAKQAQIDNSKRRINRVLKTGATVAATIISGQQLYATIKSNPITKHVGKQFAYSLADLQKDMTG